MLQTVPPVAGSSIIIESTPNGVGNRYHSMWQAAEKGESSFRPIFIPWMMMTEYRKHDPKFDPTEEEIKFKEIYGLDDEQLAWRRMKVQELGSDLFRQEYAFTASDGFLSSGRSVFDKEEMA
jgi:hypothetical protein